MRKLKIKNFGPIRNGIGNDWIEMRKVTVFIGNQGSGKSTVAKVLSTLSWIEKAINRGDFSTDMNEIEFLEFFDYQNLNGYFKNNTLIEYEGDLLSIKYDHLKNYFKIKNKTFDRFIVPKIMYVPAERNFLSVIKNATGVRGLPAPLFEFAEELQRGQHELQSKKIPLPINGVYYRYNNNTDSSFIIGEDFDVNLLAASSGYQSIVPLFIVSLSLSQKIYEGSEINPGNISVKHILRMNDRISKIMQNSTLTELDKAIEIDEIKAKFKNEAFINIVEEPEQNLFPTSQWELLKKLLEFNNMNIGNRLVMTTHSPYLINFISIAVQAGFLKNEISRTSSSNSFLKKIEKIISLKSVISRDEVIVYQLDENDGTVKKLTMTDGIPSDNNYLNESLRHGNEMFDYLLEIEQELVL